MHASPARHRVAFALALLGVAVSVVTLVIHTRLAESSAYTSFCNLGGVVNGVVMPAISMNTRP